MYQVRLAKTEPRNTNSEWDDLGNIVRETLTAPIPAIADPPATATNASIIAYRAKKFADRKVPYDVYS